MVMRLIECKKCGGPISLRSNGINDAFTPEAIRLRRKYHGKLKECTSDSAAQEKCAECFGKEAANK